MTVITLSNGLLPGNVVKFPNTEKGQYLLALLGAYQLVKALGFAEIDSVGGTSFPVRLPPDLYTPYNQGNQITLPTGAQVIRTAMNIPDGLSATDGDVLQFAGAIDATSTNGTTLSIISSVAASSAIAAQVVQSTAAWGSFLGVSAANTALAGDLALDIKSITPGSPDVAGGTVAATGNTVRIPVEVVYAIPNPNGPQLNDVLPNLRERATITTS